VNQPRIRVAVVDGQEIFRRGVALLLDTVSDFDVVGASSAPVGLDVEPDVVLVGASLPDTDAVLTELATAARVLLLVGSDASVDIYAAMQAGASGFLTDDVSLDELAEGVRVVADGQSLISPRLAASLAEGIGASDDATREAARALTARETEVLRLVALGLSNRAVAHRLGISENTVKNHVRNLLDKLRLRSRTEAALYAVREKLVEP
jgi:DNA-binding NarL/FixJ family response regulator